MSLRKPIVAGNWKMNGLLASIEEINSLNEAVTTNALHEKAEIYVCPPATLIKTFADTLQSSAIKIGGQDCHANVSGAHTGDVAPEMLADAGASAVILGHSERRADHGERDQDVKAKASAAYRAGLKAIVCIGETAGQRAAGLTLDIVNRQLKNSLPEDATSENTIIAYEPVWAIGTGLTPTVEDVAEVHKSVRAELGNILSADEAEKMRILYGGSVKPANAEELLSIENVDGALVGGASLKAADFLGIISAYNSI